MSAANWKTGRVLPLTRAAPREGLGELHPERHETLLRTDPAQYAEMVRNVTAFGIYLIDRDGSIRSWNLGAANITGFSERDVVHQPFAALFAEGAAREGAPLKSLNFARANRHCRDEHQRRRKNGEEFVAESTLDAVRADSGEIVGFVEVFHDVTEQKQREERLYQRATRDALTGAFNRGHFTELANQELERARRFSEPLSIALLDIDHFKRVNDTYGHEAGDLAIQALVRVCNDNIRKIDFVGRLGGEEFGVLLPRANKEPAFEMAQRLRMKIGESRVTAADGREFAYTASIGLACLRPNTRDLAELLRNADAALYRAKREGRNRVEVWFE